MACEKYSSWMTDAALGALAPGASLSFLRTPPNAMSAAKLTSTRAM